MLYLGKFSRFGSTWSNQRHRKVYRVANHLSSPGVQPRDVENRRKTDRVAGVMYLPRIGNPEREIHA